MNTTPQVENLFTPNCIRTSSGLYMNVFEPTYDMICIEDIAHSLSQQCRFGGHLPEFYSVAQHSVMCSQKVQAPYKMQALMHDASEAYLLDMPSPIKKGLRDYKELENRLMTIIAGRYEFAWPMQLPVQEVDEWMLHFEWEVLMLRKPLAGGFNCWSPKKAKRLFLESFNHLMFK